MKRSVISCVLGILCLLRSAANDGVGGYYPTIGQAQIEHSESIEFLDERVYIYPYDKKGFQQYVCQTEFHFKNTEAREVKIMLLFPVEGRFERGSPGYRSDTRPIEIQIEEAYGFTTLVDGIELPRRLVPLAQSPESGTNRWAFSLELTFAPNQERRVWNCYNFLPKSWMANRMGNTTTTYEYILKTGGTWKKPIGKIEIFWAFSGQPDYRSWNVQTWNVQNPTSDFSIMTNKRKLSPAPDGTEHFEGLNWYVWRKENIRPNFDIKIYESKTLQRGSIEFSGTDALKTHFQGFLDAIAKERMLDWPNELDNFLQSLVKTIMNLGNDNLTSLEPATKTAIAELARFAINFYYARHGYRFTNLKVAEQFAGKVWYRPDPAFAMDLDLYSEIGPWLSIRDLVEKSQPAAR